MSSEGFSDEPSLRLPVEAADVLNAAADLIEHSGWTSDHHWLPARSGGTAWTIGLSPTSTTTTNFPTSGHHPNFNASGFCLVDAVVKVHPQGKFWGDPRLAWESMKEPHCGRLGVLLMDAIGPRCTGFPQGLVQWNDQPERTKEEVVAVLRAASESARKDGSSPKNSEQSQ